MDRKKFLSYLLFIVQEEGLTILFFYLLEEGLTILFFLYTGRRSCHVY